MTDPPDAPEKADPRVYCFEKCDEEAKFESSTMKLMAKLQEPSRKQFVSEENVFRMNHGVRWVHAARGPDDEHSTMHTLSAEWVIPFKDIADNDLSLIGRTILPIKEEMERQFSQNMYRTVGAVAEKVGNVVDAKAVGSFAQSMLEMFSKIEFGVDRDGNVSLPQLHVGPGTFERIKTEMQNIPPELDADIERMKALKIEEALAREVVRKAKFMQASS